jgi:hypothetical protein
MARSCHNVMIINMIANALLMMMVLNDDGG